MFFLLNITVLAILKEIIYFIFPMIKYKNKQIKQVVILAGGQGVRLKPITDLYQKCMFRFHGKPFLYYLINFYKLQGIEKILILTGYKSEQIKNYFGNGKKLGVEIEYNYSPIEAQTGKRVVVAQDKIDEIFFLSYADVFCDFDLKAYFAKYCLNNWKNSIVVYKNLIENNKNNILGKNNKIISYSKNFLKNNYKDIGFGIFRKKDLNALAKKKNPIMERVLYSYLIKKSFLNYHTTSHKYYSLTDVSRLPAIEDFFNKDKLFVFLDRDGVINKKFPKGEYVKNFEEFIFIKNSVNALKNFQKKKIYIVVVTNQAGVSRKKITIKNLNDLHSKMIDYLEKKGVFNIKGIYFSTSFNNKNFFRKPNPGLLFLAEQDFNINRNRAIFFGDAISDKLAASAYGVRFYKINSKKNLFYYSKKIQKII